MKQQREPSRGRAGRRRARGQQRITSGQLTVLPHHPSSSAGNGQSSSSHPNSGPGQAMPWSLQNKNALVTDIEHQHDWAIRETRARIAEIENELLEQVTEKARLHLEFDREHPESGGHASFGTPYQHSVQTVAILKHRLETCTALLADLLPAQEQGGTDKTADCLTGSDRILEMRDDMPKFGKCDNRVYTTSADVFLDRFEVYLKTFLGPARFQRECYRYMVMLIVDEDLQYDLFEAFEYRDKASLTFKECARVFRNMTVQVFN